MKRLGNGTVSASKRLPTGEYVLTSYYEASLLLGVLDHWSGVDSHSTRMCGTWVHNDDSTNEQELEDVPRALSELPRYRSVPIRSCRKRIG